MNRSTAEDFVEDIIESENPSVIVVSRRLFKALLPGESPTSSIGYGGVQIESDSAFDTFEYVCDPD
ncbi:MAG: hypothetical protein RJS97_08435 [Parvibaculaceae bacterium]|uniref:hypothetical protein n=1 Tax=Thalassospira sp. TaxID=1912094 RepID=UPI0032F72EE1